MGGLTIPESDHAVGGSAGEGGVEALECADEVAFICAHGGAPFSFIHAALRGSPEDIEGLDAAALFKIPLPQGFIRGAGDEHIALEV